MLAGFIIYIMYHTYTLCTCRYLYINLCKGIMFKCIRYLHHITGVYLLGLYNGFKSSTWFLLQIVLDKYSNKSASIQTFPEADLPGNMCTMFTRKQPQSQMSAVIWINKKRRNILKSLKNVINIFKVL